MTSKPKCCGVHSTNTLRKYIFNDLNKFEVQIYRFLKAFFKIKSFKQ